MGGRADVPLPEHAKDVVVVLVRTANSGNLGAVARAMLNFGFTKLRLLDAQCEIDEDARKRAKFAGSVLDDAQFYSDWDECMGDIGMVIGTTGKREGGGKTSFRHLMDLEQMRDVVNGHGGTVAIVFGEEGMGLSTLELDKCDLLATIPTWEGYPICNLSHAVILAMYSLSFNELLSNTDSPLEGGTREILKQALGEFSDSLSFEGTKGRMVSQTVERIMLRGLPNDDEAQQLIGALVQATTALQKVSDDDNWKRGRRKRIENQD